MPDPTLKEPPPLPSVGGSYRWDAQQGAWVLVERTEQTGFVRAARPAAPEPEEKE